MLCQGLRKIDEIDWLKVQKSVSHCTDGLHLDSTDAISITVVCYPNVSIFTPALVPRILNEVVILAILIPISYSCDTVIEFSSTAFGIDDSARIELESETFSFNSNWSWSSLNGSHKATWRSWRNLNGISAANNSSVLTSLAGSLAWEDVIITIFRFCGKWSRLSENHSVVHVTAMATQVSIVRVTINKFLLWERYKCISFCTMSSFHGTSGRKSPARTTATLIFNRGNTSSLNPVNRVSIWSAILESLCHSSTWNESTQFAELCFSPGRELVVIESICILWVGIFSLDSFMPLGEDIKSSVILGNCGIREVKLSNMPYKQIVGFCHQTHRWNLSYLIVIYFNLILKYVFDSYRIGLDFNSKALSKEYLDFVLILLIIQSKVTKMTKFEIRRYKFKSLFVQLFRLAISTLFLLKLCFLHLYLFLLLFNYGLKLFYSFSELYNCIVDCLVNVF